MVKEIEIVQDWSDFDLVLLKASFEKNKQRRGFVGKKGFDYLEVEYSLVPIGTEVFAYGYPLSETQVVEGKNAMFVLHQYSPRVTSAIVSSHYDYVGPTFSPQSPKYYIIDKALNFGNSGGPIVSRDTGKALSVCIAFQALEMPQDNRRAVTIPSNYSISCPLSNVENDLNNLIAS